MKILVVDIAASTGGALSILRDFYQEALEDKENEYVFLLSDNYIKESKNIKIKLLTKEKKWIRRLIFDHFTGKKIVKEINPDLIISFQNTIIRGTNKKTILYLHQSIPFQKQKRFSFFKKNEFKLAIIQRFIGGQIKKSIKLADKVIVQSNWIKEAVINICKIPENKIINIPPNINVEISNKKETIEYNSFFYPTSNEIYKNVNIIYESANMLVEKDIKNFNINLTIDGISTKNINYLGKITREEVFQYYKKTILIFPSYIESYPLPLIEAKKSNAIILASDTPFSREILNDYTNAYFFDPFKPEELVVLMEQCINKKITYKQTSLSNNTTSNTKIKDIINQTSRKKILWLTNIPSPYRVNFFNELGKLINLTVLFERSSSSERDESWKKYKFNHFNGIILKGLNIGVDSSFNPLIIFKIKRKNNDYIFISNYSSPTGLIAVLYMILRKINYIIETDGGFAKNGKGLKEKIKKLIISNAYLCFSTSAEGDKYYKSYGAKKENIVRYPFTSLYKNDILESIASKEEKQELKKELGIKEEKIILSIGRFVHHKGFDILLKACKNIKDNVGIYIIGGNIIEEYKMIIDEYKIKNVHFINFLNKNELDKYYKCADIFVLATREDIWGLVINEAMSKGLPVITTNRCIAGLELIENDKNGYIVNNEDIEELERRIKTLINDDKKMALMSKNSLIKISEYNFENMAKNHIDNLINKEGKK